MAGLISELNITEEVKEAARDFVNRFDPEFRDQIILGINEKAKIKKEPTVQMFDYDENMFNFVNNWMREFDALVKKHGEGFKAGVSYLSFIGIADIKKMEVLYPPEFYHEGVYNAYMTAWEAMYTAVNKDNGADIISSDRATTIADERVNDLLQNKICLDT